MVLGADACPFCGNRFSRSNAFQGNPVLAAVDCPSCGVYGFPSFDHDFAKVENHWLASAILRTFGLSREVHPLVLPKKDVLKVRPPEGWVVTSTEEFLCKEIPSVGERLDRALVNLSRIQPSIGEAFTIHPEKDAATVWASKEAEVHWIMNALGELGWTTYKPSPSHTRGQALSPALLTPAGWSRVQDLSTGQSESGRQSAFVAMWFDDEMTEVFDAAIKPALEAAGYEAVRIDRSDHVNRIDDEIILRIRQARFVVADFTGDRGGVYYEAGFAHGLDKPVIFTVEKDKMDSVHFDTNHFPHILWSRESLESFRKALIIRILATIGPGKN